MRPRTHPRNQGAQRVSLPQAFTSLGSSSPKLEGSSPFCPGLLHHPGPLVLKAKSILIHCPSLEECFNSKEGHTNGKSLHAHSGSMGGGGSQSSRCLSASPSLSPPCPSFLPSSSSSPSPLKRELQCMENVTWRPRKFSS